MEQADEPVLQFSADLALYSAAMLLVSVLLIIAIMQICRGRVHSFPALVLSLATIYGIVNLPVLAIVCSLLLAAAMISFAIQSRLDLN